MRINFGIISNVLGVLWILLGLFMLTALPFSFYYNEGDSKAIIISAFISIFCGAASWAWRFKERGNIGKREGYLIVSLAWISIGIFGALPFIVSGTIPLWENAIFESISGLTTTGATILSDIESMPKGLLYWRSITQWIGGMGIIVLTVAIFPLLGIGGVELFVAEAPGPTSDKIHPRIKETAKRLWLIYFGLTVTVCFLYFMAGMNFFDSINHAFTTMSTGGYSTKNSSMAYFDSPLIEYIAIAFMFIGGINYTVIYFSLKGKLKRAWSSDELKTYLCFILTSILVIGLLLLYKDIYGVEQSFRTAAFQIISLVTTTGYITADYTTWGEVFSLIFFILLFTGACAGSTSGGIKIIRHLVFLKNSISEFKRILHPRALIRTRIDNYIVAPRILTHILVFLLIYLICFVMGSIFMAIMLEGQDQVMLSSIGSIASCLGNVGPAIGTVGPVDNYSHFPAAAKWLLSFYMILGRLELFSILIILTPFFWKVN